MKVAIVGGGIGGLAAAALLSQDGHDVTVFDRFEEAKPVGSGLIIQPVGAEVLRAIGADDAIRLGQPIRRMHGIETVSGRDALDVAYGATPDRRGLGIHRATLHAALLSAAQESGAAFGLGREVTGRDGQKLTFANGAAEGPFDLIVDASGASSALSPLQAKPLPFGAIWATVPWPEETELSPVELSQRYERAEKMIGVLPIGYLKDTSEQKLAAIFYSLPRDREDAWRASDFGSWREDVIGLWPAMEAFLPEGLSHDDFTFTRYSHGTLSAPYDDGIAYIGDAALRASPQLGQGANMALLDARSLQLALRRASTLEELLRQYAGARRWHLRLYQAASAAFTPLYQSERALPAHLRDRILTPMGRWPGMRGALTRLVCGDLVPPLPSLMPRAPEPGQSPVRAR